MSTLDPVSPHRRSVTASIVTGVLLLAAIVAGVLLYLRPATPLPRPVVGDVILEDRVRLPADGGVSRRVRVERPCAIEFTVEPPAGTEVRVAFGVPGPVESAPVDLPDPRSAVAWTAKAGTAPHREIVLAPGLYVVRVTSGAGASPGETRLSLRVFAPR